MNTDANTFYIKQREAEMEAEERREEAIDRYIANNLRSRIIDLLTHDDQIIYDAAVEVSDENEAPNSAAVAFANLLRGEDENSRARVADAFMAWVMPYLTDVAEDELRQEAERIVDRGEGL